MKSKELYQRASEYFAKAIEAPVSELVFGSTYELLVAVILSAQCTDKRVNMVTPALFAQLPASKISFLSIFKSPSLSSTTKR